jgi:hypothetical protein
MKHTPEQLLEDLVRRHPRAEGEELGAWLLRLHNLLSSVRDFRAAEERIMGENE